jgi:hypothetical protein
MLVFIREAEHAGPYGPARTCKGQQVFPRPAPRSKQSRPIGRTLLDSLSENAWAVAYAGNMHLVGGYGEQRVDRPYHLYL